MVRPWCVRGNIHFSFVLIQRKVTKEKSRAGVFGAIRTKLLVAGAKNSLRSDIRSLPTPSKALNNAPTPRPLAMRRVCVGVFGGHNALRPYKVMVYGDAPMRRLYGWLFTVGEGV